MKKAIIGFWAVLLAVCFTVADASAQDDGDFRFYWDKGLRFKTGDGNASFKMGGRIMNDWGFGSADSDLDDAGYKYEDGTEFRRSRLYISGTIYGNTYFKSQFDFEDGAADFKDMYIGFKGTPIGTVQVGHQYVPQGLNEQTSSKYITFIERALPNNVFAHSYSRRTGLRVNDAAMDGDLQWAVGIFKNTNGFGETASDGDWIGAGRLAWVAMKNEDNNSLLHLGASLGFRSPNGSTEDWDAGPNNHLAGDTISHTLVADDITTVGLEAAYIHGPASVQAEFFMQDIESEPSDDPTFTGFYIFGSYWITGEIRKYKKGSFSRVSPKSNFGWGEEGKGAWEAAVRYAMVDFTDLDLGATDGGEVSEITLGLNWHLNPNVRIMLNGIISDTTEGNAVGGEDGTVNILAMRFQIDW